MKVDFWGIFVYFKNGAEMQNLSEKTSKFRPKIATAGARRPADKH